MSVLFLHVNCFLGLCLVFILTALCISDNSKQRYRNLQIRYLILYFKFPFIAPWRDLVKTNQTKQTNASLQNRPDPNRIYVRPLWSGYNLVPKPLLSASTAMQRVSFSLCDIRNSFPMNLTTRFISYGIYNFDLSCFSWHVLFARAPHRRRCSTWRCISPL